MAQPFILPGGTIIVGAPSLRFLQEPALSLPKGREPTLSIPWFAMTTEAKPHDQQAF
jgi:hypothetical protein